VTAPTLCFVDVESTGLDPRRHDVWEIAIIRRTHEMPDEEHVFQLTPETDPEWADEEALKISRFAERFLIPSDAQYDAVRVEDGKPTERMRQTEVWMEVQDLLRGAHMVGAVPSFDAAMLTAMLQRVAFKTTWHHRLICVETMAATVLGWPVPQGLGKSAEALGLNVDSDTAHTALGDARLALAVYDAVQGRHASRSRS
jgi:DNA polymerase III epsilon subunit-like protein